ncbi:hypothetical protein D3C74_198050 [compost metagenome]
MFHLIWFLITAFCMRCERNLANAVEYTLLTIIFCRCGGGGVTTNQKYKEITSVSPQYWRELQVRYDALQEMDIDIQFKLMLEVISLEELKELSGLINGSIISDSKKETLIQELATIEMDIKEQLCLLREFINRRKVTIAHYYELQGNNSVHLPLPQLYSLFKMSPSHLFEIFTFHLWKNRGSGELYSSTQKKINKMKSLKITDTKTFEDRLCDILFKQSGDKNKYRIFSHAVFEHCLIFLLYKRVNDTSIPDFNESLRNQEVNMLFYQIDWKDQVLEIKGANWSEKKGIVEHSKETFEDTFTELKTEVFRGYRATSFLDAVTKGIPASGLPIIDFVIDKITFRGSLLKNSPELTLSLKNIDIWPSVIEAHERKAVNVTSLKDIASLSFESSITSRTIRSIVKENGNVLFTMDDSRMSEENKKIVETKFEELFGIPLFQEISNDQFEAGRADLVDFVMRQPMIDLLREDEEKIVVEELESQKILFIETEYRYTCANDDCGYSEDFKEEYGAVQECPECKETKFKIKPIQQSRVNMSKVTDIAKSKIENVMSNMGLSILNESSRTYGGSKLRLQNYEHNDSGKVFQILITDQLLTNWVIKPIIKQMTSLFIVFVGKQQVSLESYNRECIQPLTFGELYALDDIKLRAKLEKMIQELEIRAKNYTATAAYEAYLSIEKGIGIQPSAKSSEYNDTEFEDDVYCILKDIFVNTAKWGQEAKGKAVPEGIFSISYREKRGNNLGMHKYAFSYDCKLTSKTAGYDLDKSEQRKAVEYVNTLNQSDILTNYTSENQLTGHIFIGNCFRKPQIQGMTDYFSEQLGRNYNAIPIFITADNLLMLHMKYRKNLDFILQAPNKFLKELQFIFSTPGEIEAHQIEEMFIKVLKPSQRENEHMDMKDLTGDVM